MGALKARRACSAERNLRTPCELPTVIPLRAGGTLNRRHFLQAAASLPLVSSSASGVISPAQAQAAPFDRSFVRQLARDAASKPYKAPDTKLPDNFKNLDYDHYRQIRFLPEHALWRDEKLPFQVQFFHRGFFYAPRVDIYEVANGLLLGRARPPTEVIEQSLMWLFELALQVASPDAGITVHAARLSRELGLTVYDATYLALAESLGCDLVTADRRLARRAGRVRLLGASG